jgi:hypothetical protein
MRAPLRIRLAVLLVVCSGCAGPRIPLSIGVRPVTTDVRLGGRHHVSPPPPAEPLIIASPFVPPAVRPHGDTVAPVPPPAEPCPAADPLAAVRHEIRARAAGPPAPATYVFRNDGSYAVTGTFSGKGDYKRVPSTRTIKDVSGTPSDYTFTVEARFPSMPALATQYRVVTRAPDVFTSEGIFITDSSVPGTSGSVVHLHWDPPVQLLPFPAANGAQWTVLSRDDATHTVYQAVASITGDMRVDACGTPLAAWRVEWSGNIVTPGARDAVTAVYGVAPQYGGLVISDHVRDQADYGVPPALSADLVNDAVIAREPKVIE